MIKTGCKIFPVICGNGLDVTKEWDEGNSIVSEFFCQHINLDLLILMPAAIICKVSNGIHTPV